MVLKSYGHPCLFFGTSLMTLMTISVVHKYIILANNKLINLKLRCMKSYDTKQKKKNLRTHDLMKLLLIIIIIIIKKQTNRDDAIKV